MLKRMPLHYQASECDCVPTSVINALIWMFKRVHPEIIRAIWNFTMDGDGSKGTGLARELALIKYLNIISEKPIDFTGFGVVLEKFIGKPKTMAQRITRCLRQSGVVLVSVWYSGDGHMTLLLGEDEAYYYFFDSYWRQSQWRESDIEWNPEGFCSESLTEDVSNIANTRVKKSRLLSPKDANFSVGKDSIILLTYSKTIERGKYA